MESRDLGTTGINLSALGFGLAAIGRPGYITLGHDEDLSGRTDPTELERHTHDMLDAVLAGGITYVDTARSYGRAEEFLATWLESRRPTPGELIVGSKWGYVYEAGWKVDAEVHEMKIHTRENLDRQYALSAGGIGTHLRLYQIHSATRDSGVLENAAVLDRLAELKSGGLLIGLSTSGPNQADTIREAIELGVDGQRLFDVVQATWNLLETSAGEALAEASDAGLGVIVKEAVANGRLTSRNREVAENLGTGASEWPPDALAIAACLHQPWSSVVLSGAATSDQLTSNLRALEIPRSTTTQLPDLAETPDKYWGIRGALPWH
jgi:aryl-alcohol dehydrogenase-like predicted oxidoreductase